MQASGGQASAPTPGRHDVPTGRVPVPGADARRSRHSSRRRWWLSGPDQAAQAQQRPGMEACLAADSLVLHRCEFRNADIQQPAVPNPLEPSPFCQDHHVYHNPATNQNPSHNAAMAYPWPATQAHNTLSSSSQAASNNMIRNPDAHVTGMIKDRKTLSELCSLLQKHEARLNMMHASAAITQAAQLVKRSKLCNNTFNSHLPNNLSNILLRLQLQHVHNFGARQVANSLWSLSQLWLLIKCTDDDGPCQLQQQEVKVMSVFTHLTQQLPVIAAQLRPQELSNVWYALGCLSDKIGSCTTSMPMLALLGVACDRHWHSFQLQELCAMLWAAAKLHRQHPSLFQSTELQSWLVQLSNCVSHVTHDLSVQEQCSALWSLAQLWQCKQACADQAGWGRQGVSYQQPSQVQMSDNWLPTVEQHTYDTLPSHDRQEQTDAMPHDASQPAAPLIITAGSCNSMQSDVSGGLLQCCEALCMSIKDNVQHFEAAELAQAISALAHLPPIPHSASLTSSLMQHATHLAEGNCLGTRAASCALHAVARMHHQRYLSNDRDYSAWVASMVRAVHGSDPHAICSATDLIQTMHALVLLRIYPSNANAQQLLSTGQLLVESGSCTPHQLAGLLWLYAKLQLLPPAAFMASYHKASYSAKDTMAASDIAAMFWALGKLKLRPGRKWMSDILGNVWNRRSEFSTDQLIQILFGLGRLQYALTQHMCEKVAAELKQRCATGMPHQQKLAMLSTLGSMPLIPDTVVQWVEDEILAELLKPQEFTSLSIDSLLQMLWACARLARRPPQAGASIEQKVHSPLVQYSQPLSYVTLSLEGQLQGSSPTHNTKTTPPQLTSSTMTGIQSCSSTYSISDHASSSMHNQSDTQTSAAKAASLGHPNTQLFAWQPLRKRSGRLRLAPEQVHFILSQTFQRRQQLSSQQIARLMYVLPLLNIRPSRQWLNAMLFLNVELLPSFTPHSLALTLFALGCMKSRPTSEWLAGCLQQVQSVAPELNTSMVSGVLRGLSLLDLTPGALWMAHFITQVTPVLALMPAKQLTTTYQSVTNLEAQLCADWGPNFSNLLRKCSQDTALFQDSTSI